MRSMLLVLALLLFAGVASAQTRSNSRAWWVGGQTVAAGTALTSPAVDCSGASSLTWIAYYAASGAPTIELQVSFDGGTTWLQCYSEAGATGTAGFKVQRTWVNNPGAPTGGPTAIPAESSGVPGVPGPLVRLVATANGLAAMTSASFAVISGGR